MARVVDSIRPDFGESLKVTTVITKNLEGASRYQDLSRMLGRPAPVPSIFLDGRLAYDSTPDPEELRAHLRSILRSIEP